MKINDLRLGQVVKRGNDNASLVVGYWYHELSRDYVAIIDDGHGAKGAVCIRELEVVSRFTKEDKVPFHMGICPYHTKSERAIATRWLYRNGLGAVDKMIFDERMSGINHHYENLQSLKSISKKGSKKAYRKRLRGALNKLRVKLS